jgi:hypothetical protein
MPTYSHVHDLDLICVKWIRFFGDAALTSLKSAHAGHRKDLTVNASPTPLIGQVAMGCDAPCVAAVTAEALHRDCFCVAVDPAAVRQQLNAVLATDDAPLPLAETHAHLFASLPVFVPEETIAEMTATIRAISLAVATTAYVTATSAWAPPIAAKDPGSPGGLLGFDFHLSPDGPRLIEINTNPGGLLLNTALAQAQTSCVPALTLPAAASGQHAAIDILLDEWRLQGGLSSETLIAIVDESPQKQYLYAEFLMVQQALAGRGYRAEICDPDELSYADGKLRLGAQHVGLVYNRLTDFALAAASSQPLRHAYLDGAIALSPHPHAHALWADKRNLSVLCNRAFLAHSGLSPDVQSLLAAVVPQTVIVSSGNRERLWATRRQWFFKPAAGFGGRAAYRGDKLTQKTWAQMAETTYVAQEIVPPSQRHVGKDVPPLKVDLRCYAYRGEAIFFAARLYQGQTTNFRTPGGGFAPVFTLRHANVAA